MPLRVRIGIELCAWEFLDVLGGMLIIFDKSRSESSEVKCNGCNEHNRCKVSNIRIVKCHTGRVLLYYSEGYIKKGTPKGFQCCEIVEIF